MSTAVHSSNALREDFDSLPSAASLGLTRIVHEAAVDSTMDIAHALAAQGEAAGAMVIADRQRAGRGRGGHRWTSENDRGLWFTLVERPTDQRVVGVLALRLGLALSEGLAPFVDAPVMLKWPNDAYVGTGKISGVLVEARWRDATVDWVAIGVGINRRVPSEFPFASAVRAGVSRAELLTAIIPRVRAAAAKSGLLDAAELAAWRSRDLALGRRIREPHTGVVEGIDPSGALLVARSPGAMPVHIHAGSLVFDD